MGEKNREVCLGPRKRQKFSSDHESDERLGLTTKLSFRSDASPRYCAKGSKQAMKVMRSTALSANYYQEPNANNK